MASDRSLKTAERQVQERRVLPNTIKRDGQDAEVLETLPSRWGRGTTGRRNLMAATEDVQNQVCKMHT